MIRQCDPCDLFLNFKYSIAMFISKSFASSTFFSIVNIFAVDDLVERSSSLIILDMVVVNGSV